MQANIREIQKQAKKVLKSDWTKVAPKYSFGWGESISWAEEMCPFITSEIEDIREIISGDLPVLTYRARKDQPDHMMVAVPFKSEDGNPYNVRLVSSDPISEKMNSTFALFSQAVLFLTASGGLPAPSEGDAFSKALVKLTGKKLVS